MKKGWKIFYIICGVIAALGIALCIAGFGMGATAATIQGNLPNGVALGPLTGDTFFGYTSSKKVQEEILNEEKDFQDIRAIDLQMSAGEVEVKVADDSQKDITVSTEGVPGRLKLRYGVRDHVLKFNTGSVVGLGNISYGTVTIYIPKNFQLDEAKFDIGAGTIYIEDINTKELKIDVDAGEAELADFHTDNLKLSCDVGSITAAGTAKKNAELDCDMGEIEYTAPGNENDYNYKIDMDLGSIEIGSFESSGTEIQKEINNHASRTIDVDCDLGSVAVYFTK